MMKQQGRSLLRRAVACITLLCLVAGLVPPVHAETPTTKLRTVSLDAANWEWAIRLGPESNPEAKIQDDAPYLDSFKGGALVSLGTYDITDVSKINVSLGLKGKSDTITLLADCEVDDSSWNASISVTNTSSHIQAYDRACADQVTGGVALATLTAAGGSGWDAQDYEGKVVLPAGFSGEHSLYLRVDASNSTSWMGNLYGVTLTVAQAGDEGEPEGSDLGAGKEKPGADGQESGEGEDQSDEETEAAEPEKLDSTVKIGDVISFDNVQLFGAELQPKETTPTGFLADWPWMIYTGTSSAKVGSDGVTDSFRGGYIVCLGDQDLTYLNEVCINMGLNSSSSVTLQVVADYTLSQPTDTWMTSSAVANETEKPVYDKGCAAYCTDGTLLGELSTAGADSSWSNHPYTVSVEIPAAIRGQHTLYLVVRGSGWSGNLYSVNLIDQEYTPLGGIGALTAVSKDGEPLELEQTQALGIEFVEGMFSWNTLALESSDAGSYALTFTPDAGTTAQERTVTIQVEANGDYTHPGLMFSSDQIQTIRTNYQNGMEPWVSAGNEILEEDGVRESKDGGYVIKGYETVVNQGNTIWTDTSTVKDSPYGFNNLFRQDCQTAYQDTLAYIITGETGYAQSAIKTLNKYAALSPAIDGHDAVFVAGQMAFRLCNTAEILRTATDEKGEPLWSKQDIFNFKSWMMEDFVPWIEDFGEANGGACALKGMLAIGVFCENDAIYQSAVNAFFHDENIGVTAAINEFGQNRESGRDQIHSQLLIGHLAEFAWSMYNQDPSIDCFGAGDNRILTGYEYMAKYMAGEDVPYDNTFYSNNYVYSSVISSSNRGWLLPIYEIVYNYYVNIEDMDPSELPYTTQAATFVRNEGITCYNGGYDTYHMIGYGTLTAAVNFCPAKVKADTVQVTTAVGGTATLQWGAVQGATGYNIYRSNQQVTSDNPAQYPAMWFEKVNEEPVSATSYSDDGLVAGEKYLYKITVVNSDENESGCCAPIPVTGHESAPNRAPAEIHTSIVSDDIICIKWDAVSGASGYDVYVSTDAQNYEKLNTATLTDTKCYHIGVSPSTKYYYKVRAVNAYGESELSEATGARTSSASAYGNGLGEISSYPLTVTMPAVAECAVKTDNTVLTFEQSTTADSSQDAFLKVDLRSLGLKAGEVISDARVMIYRSGSTSPIAVDWIESDETDYDDWANLTYEIPEYAVTLLGEAAKPSGDKSYNTGDSEGIDITEAAAEDTDDIITLRIRATGTGGSTSMSFHSLTSENEALRPHVIVTISNPVISEFENNQQEQLPEESIPTAEEETKPGESDEDTDVEEGDTEPGQSGGDTETAQDGQSSAGNQVDVHESDSANTPDNDNVTVITDPNGKATSSVPATADESPVELWVTLTIISAVALVCLKGKRGVSLKIKGE